MEIRTQRLCLRPVCMADLETTHAYASDPENTRLMMFLPYASIEETAQSIRDAEAQWQDPHPHHWEFAILKDGQHIGGMTLYFLPEPNEVELGWILHKAHWRNGYVHEAALALIDYARTQLGMKRIIACCDSENTASYLLMERLGMRCIVRDGSRKNRSSGDEERTELIYEMLL